MRLRMAVAMAALALVGNARADATCDSISKAIDQSLRSAAYFSALQYGLAGPEFERYERKIANEVSVINANIALGAWNKCPPWRDPIAVPGIFAKAANACGKAISEARKQPYTGKAPSECVTAEWERGALP